MTVEFAFSSASPSTCSFVPARERRSRQVLVVRGSISIARKTEATPYCEAVFARCVEPVQQKINIVPSCMVSLRCDVKKIVCPSRREPSYFLRASSSRNSARCATFERFASLNARFRVAQLCARVIRVMRASERENGRTDRFLRVALALLGEKNSGEGRPTSEEGPEPLSPLGFLIPSSSSSSCPPLLRERNPGLDCIIHGIQRHGLPFLPRRGNAASFAEHVKRRSGPLCLCALSPLSSRVNNKPINIVLVRRRRRKSA